MAVSPMDELAARWRDEAETLRDYGADRLADAAERHAKELEVAWHRHQQQELTVTEAAKESGYARKSLRRMVRKGQIPDSRPEGSSEEIRVRRMDLPRKPGAERDPVQDPVQRHVDRCRGGSSP